MMNWVNTAVKWFVITCLIIGAVAWFIAFPWGLLGSPWLVSILVIVWLLTSGRGYDCQTNRRHLDPPPEVGNRSFKRTNVIDY